jgi:protein-disulfide isomerase
VAVRILEAARQQNLFWPVTEATLRAQPMWASHGNPEPEHIWEFLGPTGLDIPRAREDARSPAAQAALDQDIAAAVALKVTKTPGFYVNGRPLTEFGPEQLKALVATEVQRAYGQP